MHLTLQTAAVTTGLLSAEGHSYQPSPSALRLVRWMQEGDESEKRRLELLLNEYDVDHRATRRDRESFVTCATESGGS